VIDNKQTTDDKGKATSSPWEAAELASFTTLIKEAVGFSEQRGDTVNVINSSFLPPPEIEPIPEPSLLEKPWLWDVLKQVAGVLGLVLLVFGVLKPILNNLTKQGAMAAPGMMPATVNADGSPQMSDDQLQLSGAAQQQGQLQAPPQSYEQSLQNAQSVVSEDPKRVAQVVKNWVAEDG
jgi:flagellar M-ring protein FliF